MLCAYKALLFSNSHQINIINFSVTLFSNIYAVEQMFQTKKPKKKENVEPIQLIKNSILFRKKKSNKSRTKKSIHRI